MPDNLRDNYVNQLKIQNTFSQPEILKQYIENISRPKTIIVTIHAHVQRYSAISEYFSYLSWGWGVSINVKQILAAILIWSLV